VSGAAPDGAADRAGASPRFAPRRVPLSGAGSLARETLALMGRAPARLAALALLLGVLDFFPALAFHAFPGMLAGAVFSTILYTGYFRALEGADRGRLPGIKDLGSVFLLPPPKYLLLAICGAIPFLFVLLAWWLDWGPAAMADWAALPADPATPPAAMPERERVLRALVEGLAACPFFFLQPLVILRDWTASRTLSGTLIAAAANWRWVLLASVALEAAALALDLLAGAHDAALSLIVLLALVLIGALMNAFTYVLLQRSLR
jgi:hypothetical protein